jgi:hypothetical protein
MWRLFKMDISKVPIEVLEQVANKWEKVFSQHNINNETCAMCGYTGKGLPGFFGYCGCPIEDECGELLNDSLDWMIKRNKFLADIKEEIKSRHQL